MATLRRLSAKGFSALCLLPPLKMKKDRRATVFFLLFFLKQVKEAEGLLQIFLSLLGLVH